MSSKNPPFNPDALYQQALSLHHAGQLHEAETLYKKLLQFFPNQPDVLSTLGTLLLQCGRQEEGIKQLQKSIRINPQQPMALYNLGAEFQKLLRLKDALACYDQAIKLNAEDAATHLNRGNTLKDLKQCAAAIESYDRAIALQDDLAAAYWNKSLTQILSGNYAAGWRGYEWGWQCAERGTQRQFAEPLWLGEEALTGKTLLIHAEQGLGDVIQFCRYVPLVAKIGARVLLEVPASLMTLLSSLPARLIEKGHALPAFDYHCPIMSLPLAFKTTLESIPSRASYLEANPDQVSKWQQRLGPKTRPRVGLAWSGSTAHKNDRNRSIPAKLLKPLLKMPFEFHALQTEISTADLGVLSGVPHQLHLHHEEIKDFSDTAALAQEMDVVISVDTSVAHLAGALGIETWVLLPFSPDYRWLLERTDSPWYDAVSLIRQVQIGEWSGVIATLAKRLQERF